MEVEAFRKIYPSEFFRKFLVHQVRPDGRGMMKIRKTTVSTGSIRTADGSAFVKLGNTSITAGVIAEVGPAEDDSDGKIIVNVELTPICSARYKPGKPSEQAQVAGEFLNQIAKSIVSFKGLKIDKEEMEDENELKNQKFIWYIYVDMYCLNDDGNVTDACLIALLAALNNVEIPSVTITTEGNIFINPSSPKQKLQILHFPVPVTFASMDDFLLADPTSEEEGLMTGSLTVIYSSNDTLCSVMKGGSPVNEEMLKNCVERTKERVQEVVSLIKNEKKKK